MATLYTNFWGVGLDLDETETKTLLNAGAVVTDGKNLVGAFGTVAVAGYADLPVGAILGILAAYITLESALIKAVDQGNGVDLTLPWIAIAFAQVYAVIPTTRQAPPTPAKWPWPWLNMGQPQGANIRGLLGAVTVMDTPTSPQRPHVFIEGNDYNLWCRWADGSKPANWSWLNMSKPQGVNIKAQVGLVTVMDTPTSAQRAHLFVEGSDGNIWCRYSDGSNWHWANLGQPSTANVRGLLGAVTVMDTPTSIQRPHVFVEGNDYNLWCLWWNGSNWSWLNMSKPQGVNIIGLVGLVTVMDTPTSAQRAHLFVAGNDGNIWCRYSDGSNWHWLNMSKPQGANVRGLLGAVTVMDTPTSAQRPHVFVEGNDYNLWCLWSDGSNWSWLNMSKPPTANIIRLVGAVTVMDTPTSAQRAHLFVEGNDGNIWCRLSDGMNWSWLNVGQPLTANVNDLVGAVSARYAPADPQFPRAFVAGNDGNLWVDWWGG